MKQGWIGDTTSLSGWLRWCELDGGVVFWSNRRKLQSLVKYLSITAASEAQNRRRLKERLTRGCYPRWGEYGGDGDATAMEAAAWPIPVVRDAASGLGRFTRAWQSCIRELEFSDASTVANFAIWWTSSASEQRRRKEKTAANARLRKEKTAANGQLPSPRHHLLGHDTRAAACPDAR